MDYWHFQEEIRKAHSRYLTTRASYQVLPMPDLSDKKMWETEEPNYIWLTEEGVNHMRALIRGERKARVELFVMWMPGVVRNPSAREGCVGSSSATRTTLIGRAQTLQV